MAANPDLAQILPGRLVLRLHAGQAAAWASPRRFILVLAGAQSGKTSFGPYWLYREIARQGPGDYIVVTPTFPLLEIKALPAFRALFETRLQLGKYQASPSRRFTFSGAGCRRTFPGWDGQPCTVFFGHAMDPDSLESATARAARLDEAGQNKFKLSSWEAIQRRLSLSTGRALITTTPYDLGWLKQKLYDPWRSAREQGQPHPDIDVINFDSTQNPAFPRAEFERARRALPAWKFDLFYRGIFSRPAGLIYDAFDPAQHTVPRFALPEAWPRYLGLDFGGVHTAALFYAAELGGDGRPTGRLFLYREYLAGGRTASEHARALRESEERVPCCVGGSRSEEQWRAEFCAGGLPVQPPDIADVEVGIDRVYGAHRQAHILVFSDCAGYLEQKATYSRVLDPAGHPTAEIEDKEMFHFMDAERYIVGWLRRPARAQAARGFQG